MVLARAATAVRAQPGVSDQTRKLLHNIFMSRLVLIFEGVYIHNVSCGELVAMATCSLAGAHEWAGPHMWHPWVPFASGVTVRGQFWMYNSPRKPGTSIDGGPLPTDSQLGSCTCVHLLRLCRIFDALCRISTTQRKPQISRKFAVQPWQRLLHTSSVHVVCLTFEG